MTECLRRATMPPVPKRKKPTKNPTNNPRTVRSDYLYLRPDGVERLSDRVQSVTDQWRSGAIDRSVVVREASTIEEAAARQER